jgi:hypothetical protein
VGRRFSGFRRQPVYRGTEGVSRVRRAGLGWRWSATRSGGGSTSGGASSTSPRPRCTWKGTPPAPPTSWPGPRPQGGPSPWKGAGQTACRSATGRNCALGEREPLYHPSLALDEVDDLIPGHATCSDPVPLKQVVGPSLGLLSLMRISGQKR